MTMPTPNPWDYDRGLRSDGLFGIQLSRVPLYSPAGALPPFYQNHIRFDNGEYVSKNPHAEDLFVDSGELQRFLDYVTEIGGLAGDNNVHITVVHALFPTESEVPSTSSEDYGYVDELMNLLRLGQRPKYVSLHMRRTPKKLDYMKELEDMGYVRTSDVRFGFKYLN